MIQGEWKGECEKVMKCPTLLTSQEDCGTKPAVLECIAEKVIKLAVASYQLHIDKVVIGRRNKGLLGNELMPRPRSEHHKLEITR